jgi:hypothetical protein
MEDCDILETPEVPEKQTIKTFSFNSLVETIKSIKVFQPGKQIHVLFSYEKVQKSIAGFPYCTPLMYKIGSHIYTAKQFNEIVGLKTVFLNLRENQLHAMKNCKDLYFSVNISMEESLWENHVFHQTNISYIKDKFTIDKIKKAEEDLLQISEFKL